MQLRWIYLKDFRNYKKALLHASPKGNLFIGDNAQGKTSILEAIYYLITGRSFRTTRTSELVREGADFFHIEAKFLKDGIEQSLKVTSDGKKRRIVYNDALCSSTAGLLGVLQGVILVPEDQDIVKGAPLYRRRFLDMHLVQIDPLYVHHLSRYGRAMKQRNTLLRSRKTNSIETWEYEMANSAAYIALCRQEAVENLNNHSSKIYHALSGNTEDLSLSYKTGAPIDKGIGPASEYYLQQYESQRPRERELGRTLTGPHRDDISISLQDKDARNYASEGQQRCCAATLRFAEWHTLAEKSGETPIIAIDDFGISLDSKRRRNLFQQLSPFGQTFITSTEPLPILEESQIFHINNGVLDILTAKEI